MPLETLEIIQETISEDSKKGKPILTKWKGEEIIRNHSIRATVKEILQVSEVLDVVKVGIIGEPSTGKTTLAEVLAHLIHKMSQIPFAFRVFGEEEFLDMKATLAALEPVNYILYFHDLSFLVDKRAIEEVKNVVTKIRHLNQDVKIILIYDYHYSLGLDKYLRQANFRYFTSMGSSEDENMIKVVGTKYTGKIRDFADKYVDLTTRHKCTFRIGPTRFHSYNYKNPFVPCLFWNNSKLRYIIFPKREWIDPICTTCSEAKGKLIHSQISVDQFIKETVPHKFSPGVFKAAVKLDLFQHGMNVYARSIATCKKYLERALEKKIISREELATKMGLEITNTRLRKQLDGILDEKTI